MSTCTIGTHFTYSVTLLTCDEVFVTHLHYCLASSKFTIFIISVDGFKPHISSFTVLVWHATCQSAGFWHGATSFVNLTPTILQLLFSHIRGHGHSYNRELTYPVCLAKHILDQSTEGTVIQLVFILSSTSWKESKEAQFPKCFLTALTFSKIL